MDGPSFCVLDRPGHFDDGGVGDLQLVMDFADHALQRQFSVGEYRTMLAADKLPRSHNAAITAGRRTRAEQKQYLATLLFCDDPSDEDRGPSESFYDKGESGSVTLTGQEDRSAKQHKLNRLRASTHSLQLSVELRQASAVCFSLAELCKRRLQVVPDGQLAALRVANLAEHIAGDGTWVPDHVSLECLAQANAVKSLELPVPPPATKGVQSTPMLCLRHADNAANINGRVADLCLRAALLQKGNALQALGRYEEARVEYNRALELLTRDTRCARNDWERHSLLLNVGNTYVLEGKQSEASESYGKAEALGAEHVAQERGSTKDGRDMISAAKVAIARACKKAGDLDGAKKIVMELVKESQREKEEAAAAAAAAAEGQVAPSRF
jgi:hypothetical protein